MLEQYEVIAINADGQTVGNEHFAFDPTAHESYWPDGGIETYLALDAPGVMPIIWRVIEPGFVEAVNLGRFLCIAVHEDYGRRFAGAQPTPGPIAERVNRIMRRRYGYPVVGPLVVILRMGPVDDRGESPTTETAQAVDTQREGVMWSPDGASITVAQGGALASGEPRP